MEKEELKPCEYTEKLKQHIDQPMIEILAAVEHDRWADWMAWVFKNGYWNEDGTFTIEKVKAERWQRQCLTDYKELSEEEKRSDRREVLRYIELLFNV